jgi:tetrahydromethanopterin S-methyltransferase subunit C
MSGQPLHASIDAAPSERPRPTLALVLGLLAVPGSTVAWDLPAGGLYIGLPLALAAIVLGSRARRAGVGTGRATVGMVIAGLCILQMVIWTAVSIVS